MSAATSAVVSDTISPGVSPATADGERAANCFTERVDRIVGESAPITDDVRDGIAEIARARNWACVKARTPVLLRAPTCAEPSAAIPPVVRPERASALSTFASTLASDLTCDGVSAAIWSEVNSGNAGAEGGDLTGGEGAMRAGARAAT